MDLGWVRERHEGFYCLLAWWAEAARNKERDLLREIWGNIWHGDKGQNLTFLTISAICYFTVGAVTPKLWCLVDNFGYSWFSHLPLPLHPPGLFPPRDHGMRAEEKTLVVIWGWCDVYWECCDGDMTRDRLRSDKSDHEEPAVYWVWRDNVPLLASHGANQCGHCIPVARGGWKLNYLQTDTEIDISLCWSAGPDSNIKAVENILSNLFKHLCSVLRSILLF